MVVVHTLDRWARNLKVLLESVSILNQHNVGLVSITENIDWSTAEGRLVARTLGSFGEFFSDMLATHVKKGITECARQGLHLGAIPFGYQSCWVEVDGERRRICDPEHPGEIHIHPEEGPAVQELFRRYASGLTTLSQLATCLNAQGFRTRNRHKLSPGRGNPVAEPRLFTTASVRGILHNGFYTGRVKHQDQLLPGVHEALISESLFQMVQSAVTTLEFCCRSMMPTRSASRQASAPDLKVCPASSNSLLECAPRCATRSRVPVLEALPPTPMYQSL